MTPTRLSALLLLASLCPAQLACSSNGGADGDVDTDVDTDTDTDTDSDTDLPKVLQWGPRVEVDLEQAGMVLDMAVCPDDSLHLAYWKRGNESGLCETPILGGPPTPIHMDEIRYAFGDGETFTIETINSQMENEYIAGISIVCDGSGNPVVAYQGGEESSQCCGGSDLMQARRTGPDSWQETMIVGDSNVASAGDACPKMQNICDTGDTVGLWPHLAVAPSGMLGVVYRDIHLCYAKEDQDSSDLEYAESSGGGGFGSFQWIDLARGAGGFTKLAYGPDNEPAVINYNGKYQMIHFARREAGAWSNQPCPDNTDAECPTGQKCIVKFCAQNVHTKAFDAALPERSMDLLITPDGRFLVAYFDVDEKSLRIAHSTDGMAWERGVIDSDGATGMFPSLVLDPATGQPGVAYYRCSEYDPDDLECNKNQDGPRFANFTGSYPDELTSQNKWKKTVISDDDVATEGRYVSAVVLSDGRIGVAYSYSWWDQGESKGKQHLMFHMGTWEEAD